MLALSRSDIRQAVPMRDAVELMKIAFGELSAGRAVAPVRAVVPIGNSNSMLLSMPGFVPAQNAAGIKIVSFFGNNAGTDNPVISALVYMIDSATGVPLGILEGGFVTALRTGAVSGAATDFLARPDSSVLTVIGTGVQGVTQAAAVCAVRPIRRIIGVDRSPDARDRFLKALHSDWPEVTAAIETTDNAEAAVAVADVICCSTTAKSPVFAPGALRKGTHINAVGAFTPDMQEIPPETLAHASIYVDNVAACKEEAGDLIKATASGAIKQSDWIRELGQIVAGRAPGRTSLDEVTVFKSVGNAVQDVVVGVRAIDRARELGIGTELNLLS